MGKIESVFETIGVGGFLFDLVNEIANGGQHISRRKRQRSRYCPG